MLTAEVETAFMIQLSSLRTFYLFIAAFAPVTEPMEALTVVLKSYHIEVWFYFGLFMY